VGLIEGPGELESGSVIAKEGGKAFHKTGCCVRAVLKVESFEKERAVGELCGVSWCSTEEDVSIVDG